VNLADKEGNTALHHAAYGSTNRPQASGLWARLGPLGIQHIEAPRRQYATIARDLLDRGADVDRRNKARHTPLTAAIGRKHYQVARLLKRHQARR
jgi:ankyrin repeat protein